ncbi:MAG: hypothetical protein NVS2B7_22930 [Herpetosiphon sp.]
MKPGVYVAALLVLAACGRTATAGPPPAPTALPPSAEAGAILFRDKGCVTCHRASIEGTSGMVPIGPDLTAYTNEPAMLRRWLADPPAVKPNTAMPNLHLSSAEIDDLIAFLNRPR